MRDAESGRSEPGTKVDGDETDSASGRAGSRFMGPSGDAVIGLSGSTTGYMAVREEGTPGVGQGPAVTARTERLKQERRLCPGIGRGEVIPQGLVEFFLDGDDVLSRPITAPLRNLAGDFGPMQGTTIPVKRIHDISEGGATGLGGPRRAGTPVAGQTDDRHGSPFPGDWRWITRRNRLLPEG